MDTSLTMKQFLDICQFVWKNHRFGGLSGLDKKPPFVKYIRPHLDMRTGTIFSVAFDDVTFSHHESDTPMFNRIMDWLKSEGRESA